MVVRWTICSISYLFHYFCLMKYGPTLTFLLMRACFWSSGNSHMKLINEMMYRSQNCTFCSMGDTKTPCFSRDSIVVECRLQIESVVASIALLFAMWFLLLLIVFLIFQIVIATPGRLIDVLGKYRKWSVMLVNFTKLTRFILQPEWPSSYGPLKRIRHSNINWPL